MLKEKKLVFRTLFGISFILYLLNSGIEIWLVLIFIFFILNIILIRDVFPQRLPLGEFISLVFFVDNTFAMSLLYILKGHELHIGEFMYTQVEVMDYLPMSFLSSQALLIGYMSIKQSNTNAWKDFVKYFDKTINRNNLRLLMIIGSFGIFLQLFKLTPFFAFLLSSFFNCGLIGFALYTKKPTNIYILIGLAVSIFSASRSGMFGNLIYFIVYYLMLYLLTKTVTSGKKINWVKAMALGIVCIYILALMQNVKTDYRAKIWAARQQASSESFYNSINSSTQNPLKLNFYMPIIFRLNQGFLATAVMHKVPYQEPFANGSTIVSATVDAFVPRILNENKEEAGGRQKIRKFTNITLIGETSMNIGLMGESYANFGKLGAVFFLFFYGLFIGFFEKHILIYSHKNPVILVFFPIYFQFLVGSGNDFLMVFNGVVKSTLFIFGIILFFNLQKKQTALKRSSMSLEAQ